MTYQYIRLAVGRLKRYRDIIEAVPLTESGEELPPMTEEEEVYRIWSKQIASYEIKDRVMYCRLKGVE